MPEFAPEPDGAISLDWIQSRHRLFTLSISASNRLAYAWLDGTDKGHGVARFDGRTIPRRVLTNCDSESVMTFFAEFLDRKATDVLKFASLGTTEQGESGTQFRVDYLKPSGAIGFYHPDWVIVQKTKLGEVNWIIETKGRVWEGTTAKDDALKTWCERISAATGASWRYARINQSEFDPRSATASGGLV